MSRLVRTLYAQLEAQGLTVFDGTSLAMRTMQEQWMPLVELCMGASATDQRSPDA